MQAISVHLRIWKPAATQWDGNQITKARTAFLQQTRPWPLAQPSSFNDAKADDVAGHAPAAWAIHPGKGSGS
ncbi:hypothetical protein ACQKWADRAFT_292922 [Trichoderma austrokoningii]